MIFFMLLTCMNPYTTRNRFHLKGLVQVHHIYPQQFRNHPVLENFDMHGDENLIMIPTKLGKEQLHLNSGRLIHDGGHDKYNRYIGSYLDKIYKYLPKTLWNEHINYTLRFLRREMRNHTVVPWR